jgi:hypothetical protein
MFADTSPESGGDVSNAASRLQFFQGLVETQDIRSAQNQGSRKAGQNYSVAVHDKVAPFQAFRQCASRKDQQNWREDRCSCERGVKKVTLVFGGSSHVNLLKRWFDSVVLFMMSRDKKNNFED